MSLSAVSQLSALPSSPAADRPAGSVAPWPAACRSTAGRSVLDIDGDAASAAAESLAHDGCPAAGYQVDIANQQAVLEVARRVEQDLAPVVGLASVAGVASPVPFLELTEQEWDRVFDINAKGQFFVTQAFLRGMLDRGVGRIVSVSSASAQRGGGTYSKVAYSAAKAAVLGMTRALASEVGRDGVTVNAVSPGPIDTDIMGGALSDERRAALIGDLTGATYNVNGGPIID